MAGLIGPMLEYATRQTALLLDYELVHGHDPVHPFLNELYSFGSWAEPKVQQLRQFMRRLFQKPAEGREIGSRAAEEIHSKWTWHHAVCKDSEALREAGIG